jgi:transcriptional regulator with XRE-family HTH domain
VTARNSQYLDLSSLPRHVALRVAIQVAGLRQYKVAQRAGISANLLSAILIGQRPLDDVMERRIRDAIDQESAA